MDLPQCLTAALWQGGLCPLPHQASLALYNPVSCSDEQQMSFPGAQSQMGSCRGIYCPGPALGSPTCIFTHIHVCSHMCPQHNGSITLLGSLLFHLLAYLGDHSARGIEHREGSIFSCSLLCTIPPKGVSPQAPQVWAGPASTPIPSLAKPWASCWSGKQGQRVLSVFLASNITGPPWPVWFSG